MGDEEQVVAAGPEASNPSTPQSDDAALRAHMLERKGKSPDQAPPAPAEPVPVKVDSAAPKIGEESKKPGKAQQAIGKLTRHNAELKQEMADLKRRFEELQAAKAPDPHDFASEKEYDRATLKHEFMMEQEAARIKADGARLQQDTATEWTERCKTQVKDFAKFSADYPRIYTKLGTDPHVRSIVAQSHYAPAIIEALAEHVYDGGAREAEWNRMSPQTRAQEVIAFERAIARQNLPQQQPAVSAAPRAPSIEGRPVAAPAHRTDDDALKNYMRNRKSR